MSIEGYNGEENYYSVQSERMTNKMETTTQLDFLSQPRTLREIACKLKIERQEARVFVHRLISEGFVVMRETSDLRGRPKYVLTQAGREACESSVGERIEYLRGELRAERISYGELSELQGLTQYIDPGDVELLEAAGVPEQEEDRCEVCKLGKESHGPHSGDYNEGDHEFLPPESDTPTPSDASTARTWCLTCNKVATVACGTDHDVIYGAVDAFFKVNTSLVDALREALSNSTHAQTCPCWHYLSRFHDDDQVLEECNCWRRAALRLAGKGAQ